MDMKQAEEIVLRGRVIGGLPVRIVVNKFYPGVVSKLSRDPDLKKDISIALVEIYLDQDLPEIERIKEIFEVDELGIWFNDEGEAGQLPIFRQHLIPWSHILTLVLHQTT